MSPMVNKVYIFDSHPVQYKAPVYQALQSMHPDCFEVIYATDVSVRAGNVDREFGKEVVWDIPLLSGYEFRVLGNERGTPLTSPRSLTGRGIHALLKKERPAAVMLTQSRYVFDHAAYLSALALGIPVLIRQETQDEMFAGHRSWLKDQVRSLIYRCLYAPAQHAFAFGELNHQHLKRHGVQDRKISFARFSVPNPIEALTDLQRSQARAELRQSMSLPEGQIVVGFFGKLIPKKNPDLLYACLKHIPADLRCRLHFMFVGSGEMQHTLEQEAAHALQHFGVRSTFMGFINQSELFRHYLAADVVALPSRRMGEAWGLVINEALNAGCAVVMSDAVGCAKEFGRLSRARVIGVEDHQGLADALVGLSQHQRCFHWAEAKMKDYSSQAAAKTLGQTFMAHLA